MSLINNADTDAPTSKLLMSGSTTETTLASITSGARSTGSTGNPNNQVNGTNQETSLLNRIDNLNNCSELSKLDLESDHLEMQTRPETMKSNNKLGGLHNGNSYSTSNLSARGNDAAGPTMLVTKPESNTVLGLKLFAIFSTLYFFMWSSSILSQAFNLTSYHYTGHFIRTSGFLQNPLIGLMVGVITTVVFQSSGAVTSVLVTIVGSGVLNVRQSIPIIMGANLGTSVTNTVVSLIVYRKKSNFEIAMTAGIVHDMYNMMSVVFMLPLELLFHPLEYSSGWFVHLFGNNPAGSGSDSDGGLQFLSYLVKPLVNLVIIVDKEKTKDLDPNVIIPSDVSLVKRCCNSERIGNETICHEKCFSLFSNLDFSDNVTCILLLIIAMVTLFTCLIFVVKVTKSLLG